MPPDTLTRKRTFDATSAYENDAENGYPSTRSRRQRTSSTTSFDSSARVARTSAVPTPSSRILRATSSSNARQEVTVAATFGTISKPEPPLPSGIPRSVALKALRSTGVKTRHLQDTVVKSSNAASSTAPAPRKEEKPLRKSKENHRVTDNANDLVSKPVMEQPSSKPGTLETSTATSTTSRRRTSSFAKAPSDSLPLGKQRASSTGGLPPLTSSLARSTVRAVSAHVSGSTPPNPPPPPGPPLPLNPRRDTLRKVAPAAKSEGTVSKPKTKVYTDNYGCVHLAPVDCQLFVTFSQSPHIEAWDVLDDSDISCPAYLYIMAKNPSTWDGTPLSTPDVTLIDIECRTKPGPYRQAHTDNWSCRFEGLELVGSSPPGVPSGTISIERKWERVYSIPTVGKACEDLHLFDQVTTAQLRSGSSGGLAALLFTPSVDEGNGSGRKNGGEARQVPGRGWCMKFWIPVPAYLFLKKETRMFEIDAKVHIVPGGADGPGMVDYGFITSRTEMTVSHLRSEREMEFLG